MSRLAVGLPAGAAGSLLILAALASPLRLGLGPLLGPQLVDLPELLLVLTTAGRAWASGILFPQISLPLCTTRIARTQMLPNILHNP